MKTTIDVAGRVVIPKSVRQAAHLDPGTEFEVRLVGTVIELAPVPRTVTVEKRGNLAVAVPAEGDEALTQQQVDATLDAVRDRDAPRLGTAGRKKS
jgi:AbrB family looped-hinge helix DNA binding protein